MTEKITPSLFAHLVELAALALAPDEAEYLRRELNNQLKAIEELEAIPLDESTPIASHGVPYPPQHRPPLREDTPRPERQADAILAQVPEVEERYIVVPDIPHEDLA
jgi:aspartyl/glutamyl-tRNA(Asn/Gln) amidotransferase C subunit